MKFRSTGIFGRTALLTMIVGLLGALLATTAAANNLDRNTAQNVAKLAAKRECQSTSGCTGFAANNVKLITFHKATSKIFVNSTKNGVAYQCRQQIVITLNHDTGDLRYFLSRRKCTPL